MELGLGWPGAPDAIARHVEVLTQLSHDTCLPLFVGEFGVRKEIAGAGRFVEETLDALDAAQLGWLYWDLGRAERGYALWDADGAPSDIAHALARPGPIRIAGDPVAWRWDRAKHRFEMEWIETDDAVGDTLVAAPTLAFPNGARAELADGGEVQTEGARIRIPRRSPLQRRSVALVGIAAA